MKFIMDGLDSMGQIDSTLKVEIAAVEENLTETQC